jgi:DNA-binding CsgD family transcriptional regulator
LPNTRSVGHHLASSRALTNALGRCAASAFLEVLTPPVTVPALTRLGVSPDADLVFRTLVRDGPALPVELIRALGLPARRVRCALDELAGLEIARCGTRVGRADKARIWLAEPVPRALERLRCRHQDQARVRYRMERHLRSLAALGVQVPVPGERDTVRPLFGSVRVRARLAELIAVQRTEFLAMHPEPAFDAATVRASVATDRALGERGLSVPTLGVPVGEGDATDGYADELATSGARRRQLPALPTKLLVFDRTTALVPFDPACTQAGGLEITERAAVEALVELFFREWDQAETRHRGAGSRMELTARERAIVTLLAQGNTDASASTQLGLSVRTIAYTLRGLMDRYGVQNRFQLGLLLGADGTDNEVVPVAATSAADPIQDRGGR